MEATKGDFEYYRVSGSGNKNFGVKQKIDYELLKFSRIVFRTL